MRAAATAIAVFTFLSFDAGSDARAAGWCAYHDSYTYTCGFGSLGQCRATISGIGGWCQRDPYVRAAPSAPPPRARKRVKRAR